MNITTSLAPFIGLLIVLVSSANASSKHSPTTDQMWRVIQQQQLQLLELQEQLDTQHTKLESAERKLSAAQKGIQTVEQYLHWKSW